jgi:hypothetical protein
VLALEYAKMKIREKTGESLVKLKKGAKFNIKRPKYKKGVFISQINTHYLIFRAKIYDTMSQVSPLRPFFNSLKGKN